MLSQSHMVIGQAEFQPTDDFPEEEQLRDGKSEAGTQGCDNQVYC